ncbi:peptide-methionine (S)-S-oxide reductase [Sporosarcina sp. P37]|uniref:peptide-methionine (S)-S-oxide reductase MsrA n=1 Tax=unclassified Sporosarcina TaxID=2647733 RepID=UPI0009C0031F|nr:MULTISPECIES: peptide-methionine (S)-S-oxide reductase MsrA [unclassified Sporosarcina]ARD46945.1 peptide-methionine (S)-S-oxide reductase [Sporosarcina sp. P33]ARK23470.1 peptide-methionine (S)-S-oxide reductase [Sporosarcina sp. P37]PID18681.1 peptide-methionine (S)-S-oxide reductase [Sporosarcina sp. P35]
MATQYATFAGGCFWCMVKPFDLYDGVHSVTSGYTGGHTVNPTYEEVCSNTTGHREAVRIEFDDTVISYEELLNIFWQVIDPTDAGGQFHDRGESYKSAIYTNSEEQQKAAEQSKKELQESGKFNAPIVTEILPAKEFYAAEDYHQQFYEKNPDRYASYTVASGRAGFIEQHWGNRS